MAKPKSDSLLLDGLSPPLPPTAQGSDQPPLVTTPVLSPPTGPNSSLTSLTSPAKGVLSATGVTLPALESRGAPWCSLSLVEIGRDLTYCLRPDLPVGGRLLHFLPAWKEFTTDPWVLSIVQNGYALSKAFVPSYGGIRGTPVISKSSDVLSEEIIGLRQKAAVILVPPGQEESGYYSTYFIVPKKDGGLRPILNLKRFNLCITKEKFSMLTLAMVIQSVTTNHWLASLDLKDAYFHVPITSVDQKYLRFSWQGQCYQYRRLTFGLSSAPRTFTKVLQPIIAWLRLRGVQMYDYLDDILVVGNSAQEVTTSVQMSIWALAKAGFILNIKKSELVPSQDLVFIGGHLRTSLGMVFLPKDRLIALQQCARLFLQVGVYRTAHQWLRLLGLMASTIQVVEYAHLHMHPIQWHLKERWTALHNGLNHPVMISRKVADAVLWWTREGNLLKGLPLSPLPPSLTVTTDASMEGWGGHMTVSMSQNLLYHGIWDELESQFHINQLELRAVRLTLQLLEPCLLGKSILIECDNTTAVSYINHQGGTISRSLNTETVLLYNWARRHRVKLTATHRPGVDNVLADYLSRNRADPLEWRLNPVIVRRLFELWGTPQIDVFASSTNYHLPLWFSRLPHPEAAATNGLVQPWTGLSLYAFPPIHLIFLTLVKIRSEEADEVVVVVPTWPRRPWFSLLTSLAIELPRTLPLKFDLLAQRLEDKGTLYHSGLKTLHLGAWKLSGMPCKHKAFRRQLLKLSSTASGQAPVLLFVWGWGNALPQYWLPA